MLDQVPSKDEENLTVGCKKQAQTQVLTPEDGNNGTFRMQAAVQHPEKKNTPPPSAF